MYGEIGFNWIFLDPLPRGTGVHCNPNYYDGAAHGNPKRTLAALSEKTNMGKCIG